ncbi:MAG TPA: EAL domain-containing response regulator [Rubrivivax sp.]|nr:EAL domain-containing response regulator [Rubrivivax sp.]
MSISHLRFLVVEDHDFQRNLVTAQLRSLGAAVVHEAADGPTALAIARDSETPVDIVLSDLEMPGMDGMEFIRHLAGVAGPAKFSLILASALDRKLIASVGKMTQAYGLRLLGIVEKPITRERLLELARQHRPEQRSTGLSRAAVPEFSVGEILAGVQRGEIEPFMQPKVLVADGQVCGAEALARWRHPEHGVLAAGAFIPRLEREGLVDELTWSMLRSSAGWCARWQTAGIAATVSVNLSLTSLADVQLADRVLAIVREEGLQPQHVVLEVTESAATTDTAHALENLGRLRMRGFGLSIDDYGTGHSSMQQLSRIAFTELKIDRSFVADSAVDESTRVILASSLEMARQLGIDAVAEGVETPADWRLLKALGCEMAQGYLIGRPMEASRFAGWVHDRQREGAPATPVG